MNKLFKRYLQITLTLMDLGILNLCFIIPGILLRERIPVNYNKAYISFFLYINSLWIIITFLSGNYAEKTILQFESFTKRTLQVLLLWIVMLLLYLFFSRDVFISRLFIVTFILLFSTGLMLKRLS